MAKKRITQITVERTAFLTTDYFAIDSATGTNNTGRISGPNLLAQLANGPTSPTFQVKLSTLATAGLGGVSRLARGFDIFGSNPKATTAAVENLFQVASNEAASPLALRFGIKTDASADLRYVSIDADDGGVARDMILNSTGGDVGVGTKPNASFHLRTTSGEARFERNTTPSSTSGGSVQLVASASPTATGQRLGRLFYGDVVLNLAAASIASFSEAAWASGNTSANLLFSTTPIGAGAGGVVERLRISADGNIGIGQTTFGSGAVKVMAFGNGTIPGTIADGFQLVSADIVPGNAAPHFVTEAGPVIRLYQQAHIIDPAAGGTVDAEARTAINAILVALENTRLLAAA